MHWPCMRVGICLDIAHDWGRQQRDRAPLCVSKVAFVDAGGKALSAANRGTFLFADDVVCSLRESSGH